MYEVSNYLEKNIPESSIRSMYSRLSSSDRDALANNDLHGMSPKGQAEIRAADNFIQTKNIQPQLAAQQQQLQAPTTGWRGAARDIAGVIPSAIQGAAQGGVDMGNLIGRGVGAITGSQPYKIPDVPDFIAKGGAQLSDMLFGGHAAPVMHHKLAESLGSYLAPMVAGGPIGEGVGAGLSALGAQLPERGAQAVSALSGLASRPAVQSMGLYGASQDPQNPLMGAAKGYALGSAFEAPAIALSKMGVAKQVLNKLAGGLRPHEGELANALGRAYTVLDDKSGDPAWDTLTQMAKNVDDKIPMKRGAVSFQSTFDSSPFKKVAKDALGKMTPASIVDKNTSDYAKNLLTQWAKNPPSNFNEAVEANKVINSIPRTFSETNSADTGYAHVLSGKLRSALHDMIDQNAEKVPESKPMLDYWNQLRSDTAQKAKFDETPLKYEGDKLISQWSSPIAKKMGRTPDIDIEKNFTVKGKSGNEESDIKFQHLANLLNDKDEAALLLRRKAMAKAFDSKGAFDINKAGKIYENFSNKQRNFLFSPQEQSQFEQAIKAGTPNPIVEALTKRIPWSVIGGIIGAHHFGGGIGESLAGGGLGALTGEAARVIAPKAAARAGGLVPRGTMKKAIGAGLAPLILGNTGQ